MRTLIADRHPFKRVENYFIDFVLYKDSLEINPDSEQLDHRNKANEELESNDDCPQEVNMSLIDQNAPGAFNIAYEKGEWYLNDHTTLNMDTTFRDGEWYINNLEPLDVTDTSNNGGEWYLIEIEELAYSSEGSPDPFHTDKYLDDASQRQIPQEVLSMTLIHRVTGPKTIYQNSKNRKEVKTNITPPFLIVTLKLHLWQPNCDLLPFQVTPTDPSIGPTDDLRFLFSSKAIYIINLSVKHLGGHRTLPYDPSLIFFYKIVDPPNIKPLALTAGMDDHP